MSNYTKQLTTISKIKQAANLISEISKETNLSIEELTSINSLFYALATNERYKPLLHE